MGLMENRGFEVSAEYVKRFSKDLTVSVRGNFTFARNKVIDDGKYYAYPWQDQRGVRYGLTMGYRAMHLFSQEELDNMPDYYTQFGLDKQQLRAGDIRYEDLNDDGKITEADMTWIGNPAMPEIVYGFGASLNYKGFDFSFLFQGGTNRSSYLSGGWYFYPFQADRGPKFMGNVMTMFKDRWTVDNPDPHAFSPRLSYGADANNYKTSTWWQRDSGYLRLKNVEIGYTLPSAWASKLRCSSLRIYATGVNLFTVSKDVYKRQPIRASSSSTAISISMSTATATCLSRARTKRASSTRSITRRRNNLLSRAGLPCRQGGLQGAARFFLCIVPNNRILNPLHREQIVAYCVYLYMKWGFRKVRQVAALSRTACFYGPL